jgi:pSer/pThr/pTyr-binding forkhead associated (FHA) protein
VTGAVLLILRILLAVLLYAFLAWALYTLWRDLQQQAALQAARQVRPLNVAFEGLGQGLSFTQLEVIIGRSGNCDIVLEDKTVSGRHARLTYHHGQWWLEDLTSTNGTFLNDEPVSMPVVLTHGDQIRCGQVTGDITM